MDGNQTRQGSTAASTSSSVLEAVRTAPVDGWLLVALGYFSLFTFGFIDNVRGPVFPDLLKEYGLSDTIGGLFFLLASAAGLVNNIVLFKWIEKIGAYRTTQVYSLAQVVGLTIIGFGQQYALTLLGAIIIGTSLGGLGISVNVLVIEGASPARRRQALSGLHCMYGVSSLLAPMLASLLYHNGLGWRGVLGWVALGPAAVMAVSFFYHRRLERALAGDGSRPAQGAEVIGDLSRARRVGLYYALIGTFYVVAEISISTRLALYARRDWSYEIDAANLLLVVYFVGLFIGRLVSALVHLPWRSYNILVTSAALGLISYSLGLLVHPVWMAICGFFLSVFYPCMVALIAEEHEEISGYVTSWCITLQSFGIMAMHFLLGRLADDFGLGRALWLGPLTLLSVLVCLSLHSRFASASRGMSGG